MVPKKLLVLLAMAMATGRVQISASPADSYWNPYTIRISAKLLNLNRRGLLCIRDSFGFNVHTLANSTPYSVKSETFIYRATLDADGVFRLYSHSFQKADNSTTSLEWSSLQNQCEVKGFCGFNSFCSSNGSTKADCFCFPGFVFVNPDMRFLGCYRSFNDEDCGRKELPMSYSMTSWNNMTFEGFYYFSYSVVLMNKENCSNFCLEDCYCEAALYSSGICSTRKLPLTYGRVNQNELDTLFLKVEGDYNSTIQREPIEIKTKLILILAVARAHLICHSMIDGRESCNHDGRKARGYIADLKAKDSHCTYVEARAIHCIHSSLTC
ncbi:hypothetical protein L1049_003087 [Liquidambar formosana]|uniref:S-locus glycoprotein domain-containing protein n=1 Tax=Liquidambar formosana TaxID=63359 RepID=A0AAP0NGZ6_LIQFO